MKTIRINATGPSYFWMKGSFYHFIYQFLEKHFKIEICDNPDYLICDANNYRDLKWHNCVKICFTIENILPDFNRYDYVMGFDYLDFGDRYCRMPLFAAYQSYAKLADRQANIPSDDALLNRKFCSYVVSNGSGANPIRERFFHELSKYKRVDSGGRFMNNVGGPVAHKGEFCKQYKFNIAFENSASPGYVTEKIMQPLTLYSVPIYYGDPLVENDFRDACMVRVRNDQDINRAIEEIIRLDKDEGAYLAKCKAECLSRPWDYYERTREAFLMNIFSQPLERARRTVEYGHQQSYREIIARAMHEDDMIRYPLRRGKQLVDWLLRR